MAQSLQEYPNSPISPCRHAPIAVTADDNTNDPNGPFKCLYVGTAGNVKITDIDGNTGDFPNVPAGTVLPWKVARVWTTGTGAPSDIRGGKD